MIFLLNLSFFKLDYPPFLNLYSYSQYYLNTRYIQFLQKTDHEQLEHNKATTSV